MCLSSDDDERVLEIITIDTKDVTKILIIRSISLYINSYFGIIWNEKNVYQYVPIQCLAMTSRFNLHFLNFNFWYQSFQYIILIEIMYDIIKTWSRFLQKMRYFKDCKTNLIKKEQICESTNKEINSSFTVFGYWSMRKPTFNI